MSNLLTSIEKVKSFDKRLSLLAASDSVTDKDTLEKAFNLALEKAKHGEHFAQLASVCEMRKIKNLGVISLCASKATEHPNNRAEHFVHT